MKQKRFTQMEIKYLSDNYVDTSKDISIVEQVEPGLVKIKCSDIPAGIYRIDFGTIELANLNTKMLKSLNIETAQVRSSVSLKVFDSNTCLTFTVKSRYATAFKKDFRIQEIFNNPVKKQSGLSL